MARLPLEGIPGEVVASGAGRLTEQRITATEENIRLGLALGRHSVLVGELFELIAKFPLRERLRGQLMLALYRSGRQAEALNVYRETRRLMLDELGVLPDVRLRQLEHSILVSDPRLDLPENRAVTPAYSGAPTDPGAPEMLPAAVADFTGRESLVADVRKLLVASHGRSPLAVPIVTFVGKPGVGKTATAIHVGHEVAADFPDGRLFAELHGGVSAPVSPAQALERFLRALGVKGTVIPEDVEERAEMYRALLAKRRVLIILDNVAEESQIRLLLPGRPTSAVIITSRRHIGSLAGAVRVDITTFTPEESADLLGHMAGRSAPRTSRGPRRPSPHCADTSRWRCVSPGPASPPGPTGRSPSWWNVWRTRPAGWTSSSTPTSVSGPDSPSRTTAWARAPAVCSGVWPSWRRGRSPSGPPWRSWIFPRRRCAIWSTSSRTRSCLTRWAPRPVPTGSTDSTV